MTKASEDPFMDAAMHMAEFIAKEIDAGIKKYAAVEGSERERLIIQHHDLMKDERGKALDEVKRLREVIGRIARVPRHEAYRALDIAIEALNSCPT